MAVLVHIHDLKGGYVGEYRLDSELTIGRSDDCDISLPSKFISPQHAKMVLQQGQVIIESHGFNGVFINDKSIPKGSTSAFGTADIASLPGYVIRLTGVDSEKTPRSRLVEQYSQLKENIHSDLLSGVGLRDQASTVSDEETARELRDKLDDLLSNQYDIPKELVDFIVRTEVRQQVINTIVHGDQAGTNRGVSWTQSTDQVALDKIIQTIIFDLNKQSGGDGQLQIATVLDNFDEVFDRHERVFTDLQKLYVARDAIRRDIDALVFGLGPIEDLLKLPDITEIMVVGKDRIFIERGGGLEKTDRMFPTEDGLAVAVNRMVRPIGRAVNRSEPIVDARLGDGSRVHIVIPPVAIHGTSVTIRRFRETPFSIEDLIRFGTFDERAVMFLRGCILARKNLVISGGTGSGKTTLLNVLGAQIPFDQRMVVIEDSAELQLPQPNLVNLEARKANLEGEGEITIKDLVRASLRMRPDRIVVGECRGGEALDMLQAMNTGHDGSMTTGHANSPREMIQRLQVMVMEAGESMPISAIRQQIAAAVDVIVQIQRQRDRVRRVTHISEIVGYDMDTEEVVVEDIFSVTQTADGPRLRFTGYLPTFIEQLLEHGDVKLQELFE